MPDERLAAYNIREGDHLIATVDGDASHGELAVLTYYDPEARKRYTGAAFLIVEEDCLCCRTESRLECEDIHLAPHVPDIIARIYRVERGGLPVRLKGLELRGLPYAEDPPPAADDEEEHRGEPLRGRPFFLPRPAVGDISPARRGAAPA